MEPIGSTTWIERARAAARLSRPGRTDRMNKVTEAVFPASPSAQAGLRSLEQTQAEETLAVKGQIIDLYL